jgi:predicted pyridoxine 5'-phosphate oxidase superfamily flavin-nucleotide-binding protein
MDATRFTYFVVQTFQADDDNDVLIANEPIEAPSRARAVSLASAATFDKDGVLAFSRTGSMDTGDYDDAVIIFQHGRLPPDLRSWVTGEA